MKKSKKFSIITAVGLITVLLFTACGNSGGKESASGGSNGTGGKQTLRVTWWGNTERDKLYFAINDLFMKENPDVEIITESPGWDDYWTHVATAYASGTAPDVVQFQSNQVGEYASMGVMTSLEPFVDSGTINLDNWNEELVSTGIINDELRLITLGVTAQTLYANETYLEELGIELWPEDQDISWDEFEAFMNDVQAKLPKDSYALQDVFKNNDLVWIWIRQHTPKGVEWVNAEGKFAPSLETMTGWFSLADRLRKDGAIASITLSHEWEQMSWEEGPFVNRKTLFMFANANQVKTYQRATDDQLVMRKVPTAPDADNKHGDLLITSGFAISESSQQKELAAQYIDFFVNNVDAQKIFNFELGVPGSLTIQEILFENANPGDVMATNYINLVSENFLPFKAKEPGVWAVQDEISKAAQQVAMDALTPEQAGQLIIDTANDLIHSNK